MYKLLATDLDETLLNDEHHVPERVRSAIQKARDLGVYIVPASGRGFKIMQDVMREIGTWNEEHEYSISFNGACITENKNNRVVDLQKGTSWEFCNKIWKYGLELGCVDIHAYTLDTVWTNIMNEENRKIVKAIKLNQIETSEPNLDFLRHNRLIKILYMSKDFEYLKELEKKMRPMTTEVDTTFSSDLYLEFNAKGISKGAALMRLAAYLGIKPEETIAVGDSHNDVEMIEAAGLGVYMANADEALKPHANYITKANNNEGGVAEVIEKFILNA